MLSTPQEIADNMAIMTKDEAFALLKKVLSYSKTDECEVNLNGSINGNVRYARNSVTTNGQMSQSTLVVSSTFGTTLVIATINEFEDASLQKVVSRAEELARLAPENPEFMSFLGPQTYPDPITFVPATAAITPKQRTDLVEQSLIVAKA